MELFLSIMMLLAECLLCACTKSSSLCLLPDQASSFSSVCVDQSYSLTCRTSDVILIKDIKYSVKITGPDDTCGDCFMNNSSPWITTSVMLRSRLYEACSRKTECSFNGTVKTPVGWNRMWYATITYDCVAEDLFKEMCSSWETSIGTSGLHVTLKGDSSVPANCSCMIYGHFRSTKIIVVDYRPYINDYMCSKSVFYINGQQKFKCSDTQSGDSSVYNRPITISNNRTDLFVAIHSSKPQMLWFNVSGSPDVHVLCNADDRQPSSSTKITTTSCETISTSTGKDVTETSTFGSTINATFLSSNSDHQDSNITVPLIAGSSVGLVMFIVIIIVIYFIYKRKSRISNSKNNEDVHRAVRYVNTVIEKHVIMEGMIDKSYDDTETINVNTSHFTDKQETDSDYVYLEPVDIAVNDTYTKAATCVTHSQASIIKTGSPAYQEPYSKKSVPKEEDMECKYTKPVKADDRTDAYNTLSAGIDTYSHIHDVRDKQMPRCQDNYWHVKIEQNKLNKMTPGTSTDLYSHLIANMNRQNSTDDQSSTANINNNETENYDHLEHVSYN